MPMEEITAEYEEGEAMPVELHDGSKIMLCKIDGEYDPTSRAKAFKYLRDHFNAGEIVTGLLYIDDTRKEMHDLMGNVDTPLANLPMESLVPANGELEKIQKRYR
jgi:2-oxoglutarate ferredoxin oxidoreductase subunit beta